MARKPMVNATTENKVEKASKTRLNQRTLTLDGRHPQ